jgi:hypothetical protein
MASFMRHPPESSETGDAMRSSVNPIDASASLMSFASVLRAPPHASARKANAPGVQCGRGSAP